jgi:hypothetical protein
MRFDLNEEETAALRKLLADAIEYDRYPLSPRIQTLKRILPKFVQLHPYHRPDRRHRSQAGRLARDCGLRRGDHRPSAELRLFYQ